MRSRRATITGALGGAAAAIALTGAPPAAAQRRGGEVVVGVGGGPDTLDPHFSRAQGARNVTVHLFEPLITRGENFEIVPMLAESFSASEDNRVFTFVLRRGVRFHNGKTMTADDVVASLERYRRASVNRSQMADVESIAKTDDHTVVLRTRIAAPLFLDVFSDYGTPFGIIPAEQAGQEMGRLEPLVGTGPYRFVEWVPDSHVRLARFDGYVPMAGAPASNGFAGAKVAHFDSVLFRIIREDGARVAALEAGEIHVIEQLPTTAAKRLAQSHAGRISVYDLQRFWIQNGFINMVNPPTDNLLVRRAIQAALNLEEIMDVATDGAYELDPGWQYPGTPYYSDVGKERYNMADPALARRLLREAGYKGERIVLMSNNSYQDHYKAGLVMEQQLRAVGLNIEMRVLDWPTALQVRNRERNAWHLFMGAMGSTIPLGPALAIAQLTGPSRTQFLMDPEWDRLYEELRTAPAGPGRKRAWEAVQRHIYDQVNVLKFGNTHVKQAALARVRGFAPYRATRLWNVWFE